MPLLSELPVGSLLIYPTRGRSEASKKAYNFVRYGVKQDRPPAISHSVKSLKDALPGSPLEAFWEDPGVLVPVPGSAPRVQGGLWVAQHICEEFVRQQLANEAAPLLERSERVPRSTGQTQAEHRPTPQVHYDSLSVQAGSLFDAPHKITLVDDVVTRGATLIGCASKLKDTYPNVEIQAFALCRSDNKIELTNSNEMLAPRLGHIRFNTTSGKIIHHF